MTKLAGVISVPAPCLPPRAIKVSLFEYSVYTYIYCNALVEVPSCVSQNGSFEKRKQDSAYFSKSVKMEKKQVTKERSRTLEQVTKCSPLHSTNM